MSHIRARFLWPQTPTLLWAGSMCEISPVLHYYLLMVKNRGIKESFRLEKTNH